MAYPTAIEIIHRVRDGMNVPREDEDPYSTGYLITQINTAVSLIASDGYVHHTEVPLLIGPESRVYSLPENTYSVEWVLLDGQPAYLSRFDPRLLLQSNLSPLSGRPTHFYEEGETIQFYPLPATPMIAYVYTSALPGEVVNESDAVYLPKIYTDAIVHYVTYMCLLREPDSGALANEHKQLWIAFKEKARQIEAGKRARSVPDSNSGGGDHTLARQYKRLR